MKAKYETFVTVTFCSLSPPCNLLSTRSFVSLNDEREKKRWRETDRDSEIERETEREVPREKEMERDREIVRERER